MRKQGSYCEYKAERETALVECFRKKLGEVMVVDLNQIFREVSLSAAPRFYVSESHAERVIGYYRRHGIWKVKGKKRIEMFVEIARRVDTAMETDEELTFRDAIEKVVNSPAPEFYFTAQTCRTLIYEAMRKLRIGALRK